MSHYEMSECFQNPQELLGRALKERKIDDFKKALDLDADPVRLDNETCKSVFETALSTPGCAEFVAECLQRGCKVDYINRQLSMGPINFAVESEDPQILRKLVEQEGVPLDNKHAHYTPLNSLAKHINADNFSNISECMQILIDYGANVNIPDRSDITPILHIVRNKKLKPAQKRELVGYLLKVPNIDLDSYRDGEARDKLSTEFPDIKLPESSEAQVSLDLLLTYLRAGNETLFLNGFKEYVLNTSNSKENQQNVAQENNTVLLLEAIKHGCNSAVRTIIDSGVNINLPFNNNTPVEIACIWGNWRALQIFVENEDLKLRKFENLLVTVIQKLDETSTREFCDFKKCFSILLDSGIIDVNETDQFKSSPLHYAVKYKNEEAVRMLLEKGAYIGTRSKFGDLPITDMNPQSLEEHLDSCITTSEKWKPGDDNFEIIFDYKNLVPHNANSKNRLITHYVQEEMLPIEHIAKSKEMRYLLKHPIIMSFLFLKWHRLSIIFYINFILYSIFCLSLVTYIMLDFNNVQNDALLHLFKIFSFLGLLYMIVREVLQLLISPFLFFKSVVNYFEILLIILTIVMLCNPNYEKETQRVLAVCTILLASLELCLLIGSLPILSLSTHMLMLQTVTKSFLKSFMLYSIFVITFSLCFYILFGHEQKKPEDTKDSPNTKNGDSEEGEFNKFVNPFTAIIKTIVMMTGEFDAGDIDFDSLTSYLVFLLFVCFMTIVLFNLLNGLAVSDTQAIKSQAELNGCICRSKLLSSYEKVVAGRNNFTGFFLNLPPFRRFSKNLISLFPSYVPDRRIKVKPNEGNKILIPAARSNRNSLALKRNGETRPSIDEDVERSLLPDNTPTLTCGSACLEGKCARMDIRTVKNALCVLDKKHRYKQEKDQMRKELIRIQEIERKVDKMHELLKRYFDRT